MKTFLGYEEVQLTYAINGSDIVKVKCLPVRKLAEYAANFDKEPELIELCTDLTADDIDKLAPEDSGILFRKAHDLNFVPFSEWAQRLLEARKQKLQVLQQNSGSDSISSSLG